LAGLCYNIVFSKCQETEKPLQSHCKENCKASKCYSLNVFLCFLFFVLQFCSDREMYRNAGLLACKNRANGGGGGFLGRFLQCTLQWLCSGFAVALQ